MLIFGAMEGFCPTPTCWGLLLERRINRERIGWVTLVCHGCKRTWDVRLELVPAEETTHAALQASRVNRPAR